MPYGATVWQGGNAQGYNGALPLPPRAEDDPRYRDMLDRCQGVSRRNSGVGGAVAGGAIGKSVDRSKERECQKFFSSYAPSIGYGPAQAGHIVYGYPACGYGIMSVVMVAQPQQPCVETRTETVTYVRERIGHHQVPHRPVYRAKRIKEKRVYIGS